ncbi:hypothetical protein [Azorhizobium sp. AG788]|uniref:hypothetical protein n=1 Tax=Azorhizobium sp. AG788 TaxID=2183897 RepID=UPI003139E021
MHIAEIKIEDVWLEISIEKALKLSNKYLMRCAGCQGRVHANKPYSDGAAAQFSHAQAHSGCKLSLYHFEPPASRHPNPVS